ncbi:MAG: OmpA family protein, partial [Acetobacter sp.]|nr:OmpA family protein [Acetobacter sp.]
YALSVKRARSVEAELIRNGVPASEIVIRGYGDTNPLVPTGPNTREPQNRRVEIILHA